MWVSVELQMATASTSPDSITSAALPARRASKASATEVAASPTTS